MSFSQAAYQQLPTVDKDAGEQESLQRKCPRKRIFPLLRLAIAVILIMCVSVSCVRMIRSRGFWAACHGPQRNSSTLAKLPSHYTLPSGDNIPSVALGTALVTCSSRRVKLIIDHTGVWQASKGEVGNAVKVRPPHSLQFLHSHAFRPLCRLVIDTLMELGSIVCV
jgi:hypothetical protein